MKIQSLKFEGLTFHHEGQDPLFEQVDFDFPMNEIVWVKASSGSGRSSLLQIMAGLVVPQKGQYLINDVNVAEMSFEEFLPYRTSIGYGFDFGGLLHNRTLLENITLPLAYHKVCSKPQAEDRAAEYLRLLGVHRFANMRPSTVPGGVRKMACLIRALMLEPQVLLLDDPSVGLGQDQILKFFDCVQELRKKDRAQHVFISSFDEQLMNCLPHKEIFIDCGTIYQDVIDGEKKAVSL
jgi:ABC-type transporter Mla maintaining outer membrane lipid asymmetry ATPase subunit MlaF